MVDENGMDGHTTMQPEQYHPIAWLCYTWDGAKKMKKWGNGSINRGFSDRHRGIKGPDLRERPLR